MPLFHIFKDRIFAAGADMGEILVTLTHNSFPYQELCRINVSAWGSGSGSERAACGCGAWHPALLTKMVAARIVVKIFFMEFILSWSFS